MFEIILVSADWCQPCKKMKQMMEGMDYNIVDMNDSLPAWGVASAPTLIKLKDGKPFNMLVGLQSKKKIIEFMVG